MAGTTTVSKAVFVAESQGVEQTAAALAKLGGAAKGAGTATQQAQKALLGSEGLKALSTQANYSSKALAQLERASNRLQSSLDPVHKQAMQLARVEGEIARLVETRTISVARGNELLAAAAERFNKYGSAAKAANENVGLAGYQVTNLRSQIVDMGTMLSMGASPFQIMASQAGQIYEALDGPKGVKGSLAAIGTSIAGAARAVGPWGLALGAATAAAGLLWATSGGEEVRKAKEAAADYKKLIDSLRDSFGAAADAADGVFAKNAQATPNSSIADISEALRKSKEEIKAASEALSGGGAVTLKTGLIGGLGSMLDLMNSELRNAQSEVRTLYSEFTRGEITASAFVEQMAKIQIKPGARAFSGRVESWRHS